MMKGRLAASRRSPTSADAVERELAEFEAGALDLKSFSHREHLRFSFEMLRRVSFTEATVRIAAAIRLLAAKSGRPEIYHETVTIAFVAAINEELRKAPWLTWRQFIAAHPELASKDYLARWYPSEVLRSSLARQSFVLPPPSQIF